MKSYITKIGIIFFMSAPYIYTMDSQVEQKSFMDVCSIQITQEKILAKLPLQDTINLFFVDTNFYNYYWQPIRNVYKRQTPQEIQYKVITFEQFVRVFCTYNNWIEDRNIDFLVREKFVQKYV